MKSYIGATTVYAFIIVMVALIPAFGLLWEFFK